MFYVFSGMGSVFSSQMGPFTIMTICSAAIVALAGFGYAVWRFVVWDPPTEDEERLPYSRF